VKYLVAFSGAMRSGKTTAGKYLVDKYGYTRIAFAKPLKDVAKVTTGMDDASKDIIEPWKHSVNLRILDSILSDAGLEPLNTAEITFLIELTGKAENEAYRLFLQYVGTEVFRRRKPSYWTDAFTQDFHACKTSVVCDDVRFINEMQALISLGGILYHVDRDVRSEDTGIVGHASEAVAGNASIMEDNGIDFYAIDNHSDLDTFHFILDQFFN